MTIPPSHIAGDRILVSCLRPGVEEIVFLVSAAALGKGKGLTVSLLASGDSGGDGAQEIGKTTFTDSVGTAPQLAVVTYKVSALNGRYVAVKLRHDAAAEVVCGVTAASSAVIQNIVSGSATSGTLFPPVP